MYLIEKVLFDVEEMLAVFDAERAVARESRDVDLVDATSRDCILGGDNRSKRQLGMTLRQLRPKKNIFYLYARTSGREFGRIFFRNEQEF